MKWNWYNLCKKYKALDWIDDHIIWYIWDKPKAAYKTIKYWFYCNWNKEHWKLVKTALLCYPWDYYFIDQLTARQIDKQIKWFETHHLVEGWDTNILRPLKWAQHCLKYIDDDTELYDYNFETKERTYTGPRINYRNIDRFLDYCDSEFRCATDKERLKEYYISYPEEYYKFKCRYMLFRILWRYQHNWWD